MHGRSSIYLDIIAKAYLIYQDQNKQPLEF